ncbi:cellulase family glycosylhydrolase [Planctomycetes bacterium K23_9]|uniref:Cellulase (Glycosyl hydrolase family 5) n=1 Tax=Stieleria marina TaxID=1930275 RepID=A0A517P2T4_9BACT|nr:Cellulase (glycosyl hydrolase family 5) [Planctomycetes bacterium K23_9]
MLAEKVVERGYPVRPATDGGKRPEPALLILVRPQNSQIPRAQSLFFPLETPDAGLSNWSITEPPEPTILSKPPPLANFRVPSASNQDGTMNSFALLRIPFGFAVLIVLCFVAVSITPASAQPAAARLPNVARNNVTPSNSLPSVSRPYVRTTRMGKTVVGGQGELLRGVCLWTFQYRSKQIAQNEEQDSNLDPAFWDEMKAQGVNAVRFVFFDPWQRSHGNAMYNLDRPYPFLSLLPEDVVVQGGSAEEADAIVEANKTALREQLSRIVDLAAQRQMYVLINYHDGFGYEDPDWNFYAEALAQNEVSEGTPLGETLPTDLALEDEAAEEDELPETTVPIPTGQFHFPYQTGSTRYLDAFWDLTSELLKDRTNVLFELMNEPVAYHPNNYVEKDVQAITRCYQRVRQTAPDTHLVLATFSNTAHFGRRSMLKVTQELEESGVSFDNASIAFHPYDTTDLLAHSPRNLRRLMRRYPVINTEQGYPTGVVPDSSDPDARGFGRDRFGQQSMERYNVSWFAWKTSSTDEFQNNYVQTIKSDAIARRYYWGWELAWVSTLNDLEQRRGFFARYLYWRFSQIFNWLTYF